MQNHGLQRRPRVDVFEMVSRPRGPAEPYRSPTETSAAQRTGTRDDDDQQNDRRQATTATGYARNGGFS